MAVLRFAKTATRQTAIFMHVGLFVTYCVQRYKLKMKRWLFVVIF